MSGEALTVASLFSGCGGSSLGYQMAGFKVCYANEFVPAAAETYAANFPNTHLDVRDVRTVTGADILKQVPGGVLDVLDGSPPCQSFSSARRIHGDTTGKVTKYSDTEQRCDDLFDEYIRILRETMPKVFIAENVIGLATGSAKPYFNHIMRELKASGYVVECRKIDASRLGVAQARNRLIFQGVRDDLGLSPSYPIPQPRRLGVADVLPHIAKVRAGGSPRCYRSARLPCPTITVYGYDQAEIFYFNGGNICITTDGEKRRWTTDELRVLFGFPSDFVLTGDEKQRWERCARSVPPPVMEAIASAIRENVLERSDERAA